MGFGAPAFAQKAERAPSQGAVLGPPLPIGGESLMLVWPHLTGLIATVIVTFTVAYVLFQRQEGARNAPLESARGEPI